MSLLTSLASVPLTTLAKAGCSLSIFGALTSREPRIAYHNHRDKPVHALIDYAQSVCAGVVALSILGTGGAGCAAFAFFTVGHGLSKAYRFSKQYTPTFSGIAPREKNKLATRDFSRKIDNMFSIIASIVNIVGIRKAYFAAEGTRQFGLFAVVYATSALAFAHKAYKLYNHP